VYLEGHIYYSPMSFLGLFIQRLPSLWMASLSALLTMALQSKHYQSVGQSRLLDSQIQAVEAALRACDGGEAKALLREKSKAYESLGQSELLDSQMQAVDAKMRECDDEEARLLFDENKLKAKYNTTEKQIQDLEAKIETLNKIIQKKR
jgi:TolA-binding protein